jgi:hypothetical protein
MTALKNQHPLAAFALLASALAGCGKNPEPSKPVEPKAAQPGTTPNATPPAPAKDDSIKYSAEEFRKAAANDSKFPVSKHAGKKVEVSGVLRGYAHGQSQGMVILEAGPDKIFDKVTCLVVGKRPWLKVLPGQTVTLRTVVPQSVRDPDDIEWQIVEVKGSAPPTLTAEQFVKELRADEKAFDKKHFMKHVIVTGTVAEVKPTAGGGNEVSLSAGDKEQLVCVFSAPADAIAPLAAAQQAALKPGAKVKLLGRFTGGKLGECILLEPAP